MTARDFSFADHASRFDQHIRSSIPGLGELDSKCVALGRRFVQDGTEVVDIGCSTGRRLTAMSKHLCRARRGVTYFGIDSEPGFGAHWRRRRRRNVRFECRDARSYEFRNISLALSVFTLQFIPPRDKVPLLQRVRDGLAPGGALIIAEKVLASTSRLQDAITFPYYDEKLRRGFSAEQILDKERKLRGQMTLFTEAELTQVLRLVGFRELELIWANTPFTAVLAIT
jgi:tRNA (cmo5U34)-methyltransferase